MRSPLTQVPLSEPRSSISSVPPTGRTTAWRRETSGSSIVRGVDPSNQELRLDGNRVPALRAVLQQQRGHCRLSLLSRRSRDPFDGPGAASFASVRFEQVRATSSPRTGTAPDALGTALAAATPWNRPDSDARAREVEAYDRQGARPGRLVDEDAPEVGLSILGRGVEVVDAPGQVVVEAEEDHPLVVVERRPFV